MACACNIANNGQKMEKLFMHGSINIQQTRIKIIIIVGLGKQILNKIYVIEEGYKLYDLPQKYGFCI